MANITKRGESYRIRVSCGYDINGTQLTKSMTWKPEPGMTERQIEKELNRQAVKFEELCETGQFLDGNIKFAEFAERWMEEYAKPQLKARTVAQYQDMLIRINQAIGHLKLCKIQPHHLLSFYKNLSEIGIRQDATYKPKIDFAMLLKEKYLTRKVLAEKTGVCINTITSVTHGRNINGSSVKKICTILGLNPDVVFEKVEKSSVLSDRTIQYYHRTISSILSTAVEWQVIPYNPCTRVKPPKVTPKEAKYLDETEAIRLLECLEQEDIKYRTAIILLLYTGLRRGELCGLEWKDIDFEQEILHVRRESLYLKERGVFEDTPKNLSSIRSFRIPPEALEVLKPYKRWQAEQRIALGDKWYNSDRIFVTWDGHPMHPDTLSGWFHEFVKKHDLPEICLHSLRHTNATLQIAGGVPLRIVSSRLGHAQTSTTSNIYTHAIQTADAAAAEALHDMLHPVKQPSAKTNQ